ncbi:L-ornithine-N5-monooxygenase [Colletotrichum orchidophilum]|uniref:L-ornithine-N5-monooxygenase n=1 Tax=Colletotrichum orchidophilum TaxID=1209926 RepID=A0A1G4BHT5_9PEZI|nr:L-ornithine-N5-monooxygenase [Colletotrichum orchidophilum]OHF00837.1 L-ornithine-N5-monooxygenase [Colletotrichum orchidophilum]
MQDFSSTLNANLGTGIMLSCALAAGAGLLSHWGYFIRGHRSMEVFNILVVHGVALALLFVKSVSTLGLTKGITAHVATSSSYLAALFTSIWVYRLLFHPLRRFPGPFPVKVAKPYVMWLNRDLKLHDKYLEMHEKHGEFVRVGPNDISVVNLDAINKIHGPQTKCTKHNTGFYDALVTRGELNLDSLWHNEVHRDRRKIWDQALGSKGIILPFSASIFLQRDLPTIELTSANHSPALEKYEEETRIVLRTWLNRLEEVQGKPINASHYAKLIPFDNMGRVGYGRDFGTVRDGREDRMLDLIETTFKLGSRLGQTPWPLVFLAKLPRIGMQKEFEDLGVDSDESHDMLKYFLDDYKSEKPKSFFNVNIMYTDSQAILIGATDTISCTLGYAFYYIARDAKLRQHLYEEIAPIHSRTLEGEFAVADLNKLELLEAVITETLRMHAPAPINGPRTAPPEGVTIDGTYIPGNVTLFTPIHCYHRSHKYWRSPNEFIPERWTTRPELIIDRRAFLPFSYGRYDCVGRRLAWNVLRLTIAYTLWNYDFQFAPGEYGKTFEEEAKFQLIVKPAKLDCVFTKRPERT